MKVFNFNPEARHSSGLSETFSGLLSLPLLRTLSQWLLASNRLRHEETLRRITSGRRNHFRSSYSCLNKRNKLNLSVTIVTWVNGRTHFYSILYENGSIYSMVSIYHSMYDLAKINEMLQANFLVPSMKQRPLFGFYAKELTQRPRYAVWLQTSDLSLQY
ncbi:hypothetical protein AVEN_167917-1 [Araneus ventricosus]|uniref:Uncharacterized protein n=1 Tax=Araneus ventricosus TaxID=182803 RepID=A0A4Y2FVX6_ARAVE|nr:hypothetical protein AVEN_167917-1 [Araneus ventricosus]